MCPIPCSLSWFPAYGSGPRFHLQEQFFLESHHLLLQSVSKVPGRHQHVVPSILQSAGVAPTLHTLYGTAEHHGRYGVLIHDSYPDVRLFHALLRGDFPSRWLQLPQWPLVSLLGMPDLVEESLLQNQRCLGTSYSIRTLAVVTDMHHRTELPFVKNE